MTGSSPRVLFFLYPSRTELQHHLQTFNPFQIYNHTWVEGRVENLLWGMLKVPYAVFLEVFSLLSSEGGSWFIDISWRTSTLLHLDPGIDMAPACKCLQVSYWVFITCVHVYASWITKAKTVFIFYEFRSSSNHIRYRCKPKRKS